ncbi:hypothetical protein TNCV_4944931 [Trichonephila clavipes]|nr:hypothetical protein TNCV_4944931 [Trichonephila clavipes]
MKSNTSRNHDTGCNASVATMMLITMVSLKSNTAIVMLQAETGFVSIHNATAFCGSYHPFIASLVAEVTVVSNQGYMKKWTPCRHSTLLQMASNGTSRRRTMRKRLNLYCYESAIHQYHAQNPPVTMCCGAMRWV